MTVMGERSSMSAASRFAGARQDLAVHVICALQPALDLSVNIIEGAYGEAVRNSILFGESASVDKFAGWFRVPKRQAKVDSSARARFDLGEHVISVEGYDRLAGASPGVLAHA